MLEYFLNLTDVHCPNSNDSDKDYYTAQTDYRLLQFRLSGKAVSPGKLSSLIRQFFSEYTDAQEMDINQFRRVAVAMQQIHVQPKSNNLPGDIFGSIGPPE
ncbi:hypothetical protein BASA50_004272 [Batrachochytrium salamandrivorans]|uniref:Uncharacterized protein n=1 Tax=Batrachochytrium salamandrivorans TaxID=1357716 RepID=A0ABQ8FIT1_9FUNG|nr:hypothetical protein BASA50_004272 [Batrachochytrium salamandrivorans]KAH9244291.1 hypothetical protein BASA81_018313 [Batrachochytrium salamandrivorans]